MTQRITQQLLFLELNEINFETVAFYCERGHLPRFRQLIDAHGIQTTVAEQRYEDIEPWIQWVTAHTGLTLAQHGVFRLGDIVTKDLPQIWEQLEDRGLLVGAISPMNAKHRLRKPAFFVPDPWTTTDITAPKLLQALYQAIVQVVGDNAQSRVTLSSIAALLAGSLWYARPANYLNYANLALTSRSHPWRRAVFLDLLLADVFIRQVASSKPNFATVFLNAGAHIQHHYMFSAEAYNGPHRNPSWYAPDNTDPVREIYEFYDSIIGDVQRAFPRARLMLATGLHQVPHSQVTYYWRLRDHAAFLREVGVEFSNVQPLMSRDFLVTCADAEQARRAEELLAGARAADGTSLFAVDNRGRDLFVMLTYPGEIGGGFTFTLGGAQYSDLKSHVAFVALKNGEHDSKGYFVDTGAPRVTVSDEFPLAEIPKRIFAAFSFGVAERSGCSGSRRAAQSVQTG